MYIYYCSSHHIISFKFVCLLIVVQSINIQIQSNLTDCFNTNGLSIVIFISIEFDDLTHFQKICLILHLCIKWDSLA